MRSIRGLRDRADAAAAALGVVAVVGVVADAEFGVAVAPPELLAEGVATA